MMPKPSQKQVLPSEEASTHHRKLKSIASKYGSNSSYQSKPKKIKNQNLEYTVEEILDKKFKNNRPYYFIKWYGYSNRYNTWEPLDNLKNCQDLLDKFEKGLKNSFKKRKKKDNTSLQKLEIDHPVSSQNDKISTSKSIKAAKIEYDDLSYTLKSNKKLLKVNSEYEPTLKKKLKANSTIKILNSNMKNGNSINSKQKEMLEYDISSKNNSMEIDCAQTKDLNLMEEKLFEVIPNDQLDVDKFIGINFPKELEALVGGNGKDESLQDNQLSLNTKKSSDNDSEKTTENILTKENQLPKKLAERKQNEILDDIALGNEVPNFEILGENENEYSKVLTNDSINNSQIHPNFTLLQDNNLIEQRNEGSFDTDIPEKICGLSYKDEDKDLVAIIQWTRRENGIRPSPTEIKRSEAFERIPLLLLYHYESRMILKHKDGTIALAKLPPFKRE